MRFILIVSLVLLCIPIFYYVSLFSTNFVGAVAYAGKISGGSRLWRPRRGSGEAEPPPGRRRIFENLEKDFLKKIKKLHYFGLFFKKFQNPALNFREFGRKTQLVLEKLWENFENFWWKFNEKLNFYLFFGKVLAKIEPSVLSSFF